MTEEKSTMRRMSCWLIGAMLVTAMSATAQWPPPPGEGMTRPSGQHLELLRMWRLVDELQLDEAQARKVFPVMSRLRREIKELRKNRLGLERELAADLESGADDSRLEAQIERVRVAGRAIRDCRSRIHGELDAVLTLRQRAQLLLFEDTFRSELREIVSRMRRSSVEGGRPRGDRSMFRGKRGSSAPE
ncbi:MAG: hypothetical protein VX733_11370 [Candidatus Latescibacterota bacterium]|nr:hypothetical protein [Candidatus Latescibacterota bacterium]